MKNLFGRIISTVCAAFGLARGLARDKPLPRASQAPKRHKAFARERYGRRWSNPTKSLRDRIFEAAEPVDIFLLLKKLDGYNCNSRTVRRCHLAAKIRNLELLTGNAYAN